MNTNYNNTATIKSTAEKVINDTANAVEQAADDLSTSAQHTTQSLTEGIKNAAERARDGASTLSQKANHAAEVALDTLADRTHRARRTAMRLNEATCDYVAGNPVKSVAMAAAAGAVLAYLMTHRGHRH